MNGMREATNGAALCGPAGMISTTESRWGQSARADRVLAQSRPQDYEYVRVGDASRRRRARRGGRPPAACSPWTSGELPVRCRGCWPPACKYTLLLFDVILCRCCMSVTLSISLRLYGEAAATGWEVVDLFIYYIIYNNRVLNVIICMVCLRVIGFKGPLINVIIG